MTLQRAPLVWLLAACSIVAFIPIVGCNKPDDGMSAEQQKKTDRIDEIAKKSDGDWEKVSPDDRDYLLKNVTSGSESAAKMLLLGKAGKLGVGPGKGGPQMGGAAGLPPGGVPAGAPGH